MDVELRNTLLVYKEIKPNNVKNVMLMTKRT